jgi:hypothetical protein
MNSSANPVFGHAVPSAALRLAAAVVFVKSRRVIWSMVAPAWCFAVRHRRVGWNILEGREPNKRLGQRHSPPRHFRAAPVEQWPSERLGGTPLPRWRKIVDNCSLEAFPMVTAPQQVPIPIVMEEVTDPVELAKARARGERFARNLAWFEAHALEIGAAHRGQCICIAGQELFVADTPQAVRALAKAAHPEDDGFFLHYIPRERTVRIYADRRRMAVVR